MQIRNITEAQACSQVEHIKILLQAVNAAGFVSTTNSFSEFPEFRQERYSQRFYKNVQHPKYGKVTYLFGITYAPGYRDADGGHKAFQMFVFAELMGPTLNLRTKALDKYVKLGEWHTVQGASKGFGTKAAQVLGDFMKKTTK